MRKKRKILVLALIMVLACMFVFSACNETPPGNQDDNDYSGPYAIRLTAIGQTTIKAGQTVQLRSSVTGTTSKDVAYSSSDFAVASVNDKGLVTGLKAGNATITASLVIEPKCKQTITITVEQAVVPTKITIEQADSVQWVGQTLQLNAAIEPSDAYSLIDWTSSDEDIASVDADGLVTFNGEGNVSITATSAISQTVNSTMTFTVKEGFFRNDLGSPYWDISTQRDDVNPHVSLDIDASKAGYHSLYLSNVSAVRYYVEGYFEIKEQATAWVWQGIGIGSGLSDTSTRYGMFSPRVDGQGNNYNKFIVKDLPNETWPAITTRSQIWGENGLDQVNWQTDKVKFALLRDNNKYYYLINDRLMYVDETSIYEDVATMPIFVAIDVKVDVTDYSVITDGAELDNMLSMPKYRQKLYASNDQIVDISDGVYTFESNNVLSKDNKAKSIGDNAKLVGDFEVEFDIDNMLCNTAHSSAFTGLSLNLSRYESADTVETFIFGTSANQGGVNGLAGMYSWNYNYSFEDARAPYYWLESSNPIANPSGAHHVKITRTIVDNKAVFKMFIDGNEVVFDELNNQWAEMTSKYTGAYILWVAGEYASGQIKNLQISSNL
jgi:hypothetical protein